MQQFRDYYKLLDISFSATETEIKTAYRKMARLFHPDMHPENAEHYTAVFQEIKEAYETLSDAYKKEMYDMQYRRNVLQEEPAFEEYYYEPQYEYQEYQKPVPPKRKSYVPYGALVILIIYFVRMVANISPTATEAKYDNNAFISPAIQRLVDSLNRPLDSVKFHTFQPKDNKVVKPF